MPVYFWKSRRSICLYTANCKAWIVQARNIFSHIFSVAKTGDIHVYWVRPFFETKKSPICVVILNKQEKCKLSEGWDIFHHKIN